VRLLWVTKSALLLCYSQWGVSGCQGHVRADWQFMHADLSMTILARQFPGTDLEEKFTRVILTAVLVLRIEVRAYFSPLLDSVEFKEDVCVRNRLWNRGALKCLPIVLQEKC